MENNNLFNEDEKVVEFANVMKDAFEYTKYVCEHTKENIYNPFYYTQTVGDKLTRFVYERLCKGKQGMQFKPTLDDVEGKRIYRGIHKMSLSRYRKILKSKYSTIFRQGYLGAGMYVSESYNNAKIYADRRGGVLEAVISPDAKLITKNDLNEAIYEFKDKFFNSNTFKNLDENLKEWIMINFPFEADDTFTSAMAGFLGYDGVKLRSNSEVIKAICLVNLDKVTFKDKGNGKVKKTKPNKEIQK